MTDKPSLQKRAWDNLSSINVNDKTEKKNGLTYLSWAWAWGVLMEHYPESSYLLHPNQVMTDGSVMVGITLTIAENGESFSRDMWLPVMDFKNKAVVKPNAVEINKAYMRCLAKAIAMCGLGHYIYAGDDLPQEDDGTARAAEQATPKVSQQEIDEKAQALAKTMADKMSTAESREKLAEMWKYCESKLKQYPQYLANLKDVFEVRTGEFDLMEM